MKQTDIEDFAARKARANEGHAEDQFALGVMLFEGTQVEKDASKAAKWFQLAADQGHPGASNNLGILLLRGDGVEADVEQAFEMFAAGAEKGDPYAQCNLGECYLDGKGTAQDKQLGLEWIKKSADNWSPVGQFMLGNLYMEGKGVSRDEKEAVKWFRRAASQDFAPAIFALAQAYESGLGVDPNAQRAEKWYREVQHINPEAADKLASLYISGRVQNTFSGNSEANGNERSAINHWRIAARLGHEASKARLSELGLPLDCCDNCRWRVECPLRDATWARYGEIPDYDFSTYDDWGAKDMDEISGPLMSVPRDKSAARLKFRIAVFGT